jgi:hypothetical protein
MKTNDEEERWYCSNCLSPLILKNNVVVEDETKLLCHKCYKVAAQAVANYKERVKQELNKKLEEHRNRHINCMQHRLPTCTIGHLSN